MINYIISKFLECIYGYKPLKQEEDEEEPLIEEPEPIPYEKRSLIRYNNDDDSSSDSDDTIEMPFAD